MFITYIFIKALYLNTKQCDRGAIKKGKKQGNWQHGTHKTRKPKQQYNTICIGHLYIAQQISKTIVHIVAPKLT
jgi:hypothetical protein